MSIIKNSHLFYNLSWDICPLLDNMAGKFLTNISNYYYIFKERRIIKTQGIVQNHIQIVNITLCCYVVLAGNLHVAQTTMQSLQVLKY